jgi:hypothetical protein
MSNNRELSQFGNYISVNTNEIVGINTDLIISGIITAISYYGDGSNLTGIAAVGLTTATELNVTGITSLTNLTVSGISTFGNIVLDPVGIITASAGVVTYYGDGQYLQNILSGVGVATESGLVGTGATIIDFRGSGISTVTVTSGIATINITGGAGLYVNKYGDNMFAGLGVTIGSLSSPSIYFNGYTNSGFYSPSDNEFGVVVSGTERLNVNAGGINVVGVVTATTLSSTNLNSTNVNVVGVVTATTLSSTNLNSTNVNVVGVVTATSVYANGQELLRGVGIATEGGTVGSGATIIDFRGAGISTVTVASGIATVNIVGGGSVTSGEVFFISARR